MSTHTPTAADSETVAAGTHPAGAAPARSSLARSTRRRSVRVLAALLTLLTTIVAVAGTADAATRVRVSNGRLLITGDSTSEDITISAIGSGDYLIEIGLEESLVAEDVTSMSIRVGGGDDRVRLFDVNLAGDLLVDLGPGSNEFRIDNSEIARNLTLRGGTSDDTLRVDRSIVEGRTNILVSRGADDVTVRGGEFNAFSFGAAADGRNRFVVESSPLFHRTTLIRGGRDGDIVELGAARLVGATTVSPGSGDDTVTMGSQAEAASLRIDGGAGADVIELDGPDVRGAAVLGGGTGNDQISVVNGDWQGIQIRGGSGDDIVDLIDAAIEGNVDIRLDAGNDTAALIGDGRTSGSTRLNGGSGTDTLEPLNWRFGGAPDIRAFEIG